MQVQQYTADSSFEGRLCLSCSTAIPPARLKALPTASKCVRCLEREGDVPRLKRYDEYIGTDGEEVVSTYFKKPTPYIAWAINRLMSGQFLQPITGREDNYDTTPEPEPLRLVAVIEEVIQSEEFESTLLKEAA